jgi:Domain of unknown function (DUF4224)
MSEDVPAYGSTVAASAVISAEDMKTLSGYKQKGSIAKWCTKNKIKFFRDARGWPVTTQAALDRALSPGRTTEGPDWGACDTRTARRQREVRT